MNCTLAIPIVPEALADTVLIPDKIDPAAGAVIVTVGGGFVGMLLVAKAKSPLMVSTPLEFFERTR
jgi:hypothetical protein